MGEIVMGAITPHPPIIVAEVGGDERQQAQFTVEGLESLAREIVSLSPDVLVIISPHGPVFHDGILILGGESLGGDFRDFGNYTFRLDYRNNIALAERIAERAREKGVFATVADKAEAKEFGIELKLDHGMLVPLDYLHRAGFKGQLVVMGMALLAPDELYDFGRAIQAAIEESNEKVAVIASGDLSHRLIPTAPAGFNPRGKEFDQALVQALEKGDFAGIMDLDHDLIEEAGECGYRPINILLGVFDGYRAQTTVYSYEGPFGVGYLVAGIKPLERSVHGGKIVNEFRDRRNSRLAQAALMRHPIVNLAVKSLEHFLQTGEYLRDYDTLPGDLPSRAGVFVSIKKHGQLRGCIGTISATQSDLAKEVIKNAVSAGTEDPRFFPIEPDELASLSFSVDVLGEEEEISGPEFLDPKEYGVVVRRGNRSGLLLPNLEGVDTVDQQLAIVRQKAGISPKDEVKLSRFRVQRFT